MLDYLLIRPDDRPLWLHNSPDTLRFLVVDELHTFDGAQGCDLGCLIRRLKARLATSKDYLCCVGTSATLETPEEPERPAGICLRCLRRKVRQRLDISESRLSAGEFLGDCLISHVDIVPREKAIELGPAKYNNYEEYIQAQHGLWLDEEIQGDFNDTVWRIALGEKISRSICSFRTC